MGGFPAADPVCRGQVHRVWGRFSTYRKACIEVSVQQATILEAT
jgi:hypothetical protein